MVRKLLAMSGAVIVIVTMAGYVGRAQDRSMQSANTKAASNPKPGKASVASPVNLNSASAAELRTLPNIGAATAARILEYRQKNGGFKKIEDLMNVRGIGEKSFLKLKPLVTVVTKTSDR